MPRYRFSTTIDCHLVDGTKQTLRRFEVEVEADNRLEAQRRIESVAREAIDFKGGDLTDAPVETIEVRSIERISTF